MSMYEPQYTVNRCGKYTSVHYNSGKSNIRTDCIHYHCEHDMGASIDCCTLRGLGDCPCSNNCNDYANKDEIYLLGLEVFKKQKEAKIKEHVLEEKNKITFIGNDLLLNAYEFLLPNYSTSDFIIDKSFTYDSLKETIKEKINDNTLSHNMILLLDNNIKITKDEYLYLIDLCNEHNIYILSMNKPLNIDKENVTIIDFYKEIKDNNNYLMVDHIHLTKEGNIALVNTINNYLNK